MLWLTILVWCASGVHAARAEDAAHFYRTHTLTLGSPNSPGGGYDVYVRALARYIGRYIPGHPTVIVQNIPAAGGMVLANQLYNTLPTDGMVRGTVIQHRSISRLTSRLTDASFAWIGSMK